MAGLCGRAEYSMQKGFTPNLLWMGSPKADYSVAFPASALQDYGVRPNAKRAHK